MALQDFLIELLSNPALMVTVLLTLGVIVVNGMTDAPNAIATCVSTRSLSVGKSIFMAAVFNFLGVLVMSLINARVAETIYKMVDFRGDLQAALIALCAAMVAIVVWSLTAWSLGLPTSEGHALIAGISGAAIALQGGFGGIIVSEWLKVVYGIFFSIFLGSMGGFLIARLASLSFRNVDRRKATPLFKAAQVLASAGMAFMHGAQDGQKFMAVLILGILLVRGEGTTAAFDLPLWMILLCSFTMAAGTAIGGRRIIKKVGLQMVRLEPFQGFSADAAAAFSLFLSSLLGFPVSTTHTKMTAMLGVGVARRASNVKWHVAREMALNWLLTFPGCGLLGYLMTFLFLRLFQN